MKRKGSLRRVKGIAMRSIVIALVAEEKVIAMGAEGIAMGAEGCADRAEGSP